MKFQGFVQMNLTDFIESVYNRLVGMKLSLTVLLSLIHPVTYGRACFAICVEISG